MHKTHVPASAGARMKRRQSKTMRKSRRLALKRRRENRRSSVGEVYNLTPGKATNENGTLAERAAEQLGEAAAKLHDQQARSARKGKTKGRRKTKPTKGKTKGKTKKKDNHAGRRVGDSFWENPDETPRKSLEGLFDGSEGSTPQTRSSEEEPNTEDKKFIRGDDEPESDPSYHPSEDESEWGSGLENPFEEMKKDEHTPLGHASWVCLLGYCSHLLDDMLFTRVTQETCM